MRKKVYLNILIILLTINIVYADCIIENNSIIKGDCKEFYKYNQGISFFWIIALAILLAIIYFVIEYYKKHFIKRKDNIHIPHKNNHNSVKKHHNY